MTELINAFSELGDFWLIAFFISTLVRWHWWQFERHQWQSSNPTSEITDPNESSAWGGSQWRVNWNSAGEQIVSLYNCCSTLCSSKCTTVQSITAPENIVHVSSQPVRLLWRTSQTHHQTTMWHCILLRKFMALMTLFCCHSRTFLRISVVFFQWNFAGVPRVCPPLIRQTIQLPRPHRKRKLDVTRPATAPRKIVTNKQWWPKIVQRNAVGQLTLKNVWKTRMFGYFQNTWFQPQTASRGKRARLMFYFSSVCIRSF